MDKSPSVCRQSAIKQSKEEQYLVATVVKSYGIVSKKEKSSASTNRYDYNTNYYNHLHCSYYDENKGYECNVDIERRCFSKNLFELKENDKIMICRVLRREDNKKATEND